MNLTLKVTKKESTNMSSLVKQMCSLKCRINVDLANGNISIVDMDDNNVENVIDTISEAFDITGIDIIPTVVPTEPEMPVITENFIKHENSEEQKAEETPVEETSGEGVSEASVEESENNDTEEMPVEETSGEGVSETPPEKPKDKGTKISAEDYLAEVVADALNSLDKSMPVEAQIDDFLDAIDFSNGGKLVKSSFIAACIVKKVSYENIILELRHSCTLLKEEAIKAILKDQFMKWLAKHPDVKKRYPKISFMVLLKIFARKMA